MRLKKVLVGLVGTAVLSVPPAALAVGQAPPRRRRPSKQEAVALLEHLDGHLRYVALAEDMDFTQRMVVTRARAQLMALADSIHTEGRF